jgi:hypothetical protein
MWLVSLKASKKKSGRECRLVFTVIARRSTVSNGEIGGDMIVQMILWIALGILGCAAFAALGVWAAITDEGHTAQRRRAMEMQAIPVPAWMAGETQALLARMGPH